MPPAEPRFRDAAEGKSAECTSTVGAHGDDGVTELAAVAGDGSSLVVVVHNVLLHGLTRVVRGEAVQELEVDIISGFRAAVGHDVDENELGVDARREAGGGGHHACRQLRAVDTGDDPLDSRAEAVDPRSDEQDGHRRPADHGRTDAAQHCLADGAAAAGGHTHQGCAGAAEVVGDRGRGIGRGPEHGRLDPRRATERVPRPHAWRDLGGGAREAGP